MNAMYRATVLSSTLQNVICIGCYNLYDQSISVHHVHEQQCSKSAESVCLLVPGSSPIASSPLWWCHIAFHYQSQLSRWFRQALGWIGSTGCSVSHNDCDSYELHHTIFVMIGKLIRSYALYVYLHNLRQAVWPENVFLSLIKHVNSCTINVECDLLWAISDSEKSPTLRCKIYW